MSDDDHQPTEEEQRAWFTNELALQVMRTHRENEEGSTAANREFLAAFVNDGYRFGAANLADLAEIDPELREYYFELVGQDTINYDGPSVDELLEDDDE